MTHWEKVYMLLFMRHGTGGFIMSTQTSFHRRKVSSKNQKPEHTCGVCGDTIQPGGYFIRRRYRERALCYYEAMHAGTMYPVRCKSVCESCMTDGEKNQLAELIQ